ncbi:hypothetical protein [Pajaroellobacter abortibovis]|uniref:Tetratricopeptide repeat-like domain-containing protein n=1 Tax=Pajaroellobacter abortibovis TaxID=1882918 RepID=A0A1L6MXD1_9BACT|nr:hypothetical protein [Pajaroellobacter abortibovis]APS00162.1 hypothetical protein BCY86_05305 [Pajaroellobacter abortibovis]
MPQKLNLLSDFESPELSTVSSAHLPSDPLFDYLLQGLRWIRKRRAIVISGAVAIGVALLALVSYLYVSQKKEAQAVLQLTKSMQLLNTPLEDKRGERRTLTSSVPSFKTFEERRAAALKAYRRLEAQFSSTAAAKLARLHEASLLLDMRYPQEAILAFLEVRNSVLAQLDKEIYGRAVEGLGFAYELQSRVEKQSDAMNSALAAFRELETIDSKGFKELGLYHQARCYETQGDIEKAKALLWDVYHRTHQSTETAGLFVYLKRVVEAKLRVLDPEVFSALYKKEGGGKSLTQAQLNQLLKQIEKPVSPQSSGSEGVPAAPKQRSP